MNKEEHSREILNEVRVNSMRYADDTMVMVDSLEGLQTLMDRITHYSQQHGLKITSKKLSKW